MNVAAALEALSVLGWWISRAVRSEYAQPAARRRTCYDHIAGTVGVSLHDRFKALGWLSGSLNGKHDGARTSPAGSEGICRAGH